MEQYILRLFVQGTINELVVIKGKGYYSVMEMVKSNLIANNIKFITETKKDRTLIRKEDLTCSQ